MIFTLAWRNLWRHRRRTSFMLVALSMTCLVLVFLPSLQSGTYSGMVQNYIGVLDGYAQVQTEEFLDAPSIRNSFPLDSSLQADLQALPDGVHAGRRAVAYALLASEQRSLGVQILGVQPEEEPLVSTIPHNLVQGRFIENEEHIVLGETLAGNLRVSVGDSVTLLGVTRDGSLAADVLTVSGLFRTGMLEIDRQLAEISLTRFDSTFEMNGERHTIVINGGDRTDLREAVATLRPSIEDSGLTLRDWTELQPGLYSAIQLDAVVAVLIYAVLVAVVAGSLLNTIFMSVLERTREFGMIMALGVKPGFLALLLWVEIGLLAAVGVVLGAGAGGLLTLFFARRGLEFESAQAVFQQYGMSATLYPELTSLTLLLGPGVLAVALLLVGLLPAGRVSRLKPLDAMRAS